MSNNFYYSLTKEQRKIYCKCKKEAEEFFCRPKGYVLHHVDSTLQYEDVDRYIQWRIEDLVMMSRSDHMKWHSKYDENWKGKRFSEAKSEETKKKISEAMKGEHLSEETKSKLSKNLKGKHWHVENGKRVWTD